MTDVVPHPWQAQQVLTVGRIHWDREEEQCISFSLHLLPRTCRRPRDRNEPRSETASTMKRGPENRHASEAPFAERGIPSPLLLLLS